MSKPHPTDLWSYWNATEDEVKELKNVYDTLIKEGAKHESIRKIFDIGRRTGRDNEIYDQSEMEF